MQHPTPNKKTRRRYRRHAELVEQAKEYTNEHGLVVDRIPEELMGQLRYRRLTVADDKCVLEPNVEGLKSRWWIPRDADQYMLVITALRNIQHQRLAQGAEVTT